MKQIPIKRRANFWLVPILLISLFTTGLEANKDQDLDSKSYNLGVIGAFSEVVSLGIKRMAFSAALSPQEMSAILPQAREIVKQNKVLCYLEKDLIVTDLFPEDVAEGKEVLIIYSGEWLNHYLALKEEKEEMVGAGIYNEKNRKETAFRLGYLLSYSEDKICGLMNIRPGETFGTGLDSPQKVIRELYRLVSWPAGTLPDWNQIKDLFLEEGVIILKSREGFDIVDREGFIDLWLRDVNKYRLKDNGFSEELVAFHLEQSGDIAHGLAVYGASIPGMNRPPQLGIDAYHLIKKGNRWYITSVINEVLRPGVKIPEPLKEKTELFIKKIKEKFSK